MGHTAKLTVRGLAETGEEIDRFVIARKVRRG